MGIVVGFGIGYYGNYFSRASSSTQSFAPSPNEQPSISRSEIYLPAVDNNGKGVVTKLTVESKPGEGRVLTNIDKLLFWVDTQQSIQTAKTVAEDMSGINGNQYDLIYSIEGDNTTIVGGPSAGAALTIATIAVLENKTLNKNVMITGTIEPDGSIGQVGGVLEKAKAAKDIGTTLFLVPQQEGQFNYLKPVQSCYNEGGFVVCQTSYEKESVNIGADSGIVVREVGTIKDALPYFLSQG